MVTVTNKTGTTEVKKGKIKLEKTISGMNWDEARKYLTFTVTPAPNIAGDAPLKTINGTDNGWSLKSGSSNTYEYTIDDIPVGAYTVREINDLTDTDYSCVTTVNGVKNDYAEFKVNADAETLAPFTNSYLKKTGSITIYKAVTGERNWNNIRDTISFTITKDGETTPLMTLNADNLGAVVNGMHTATITGLEAGATYKVTETFSSEDGNYTRTTNVTANGNTSQSTKGSVKIIEGQSVPVTFTNDYSKKKASLKLTKHVNGADADSLIETYVFKLKKGDKTERTIKGSLFEKQTDGSYSYTINNLNVGDTYTLTETIPGENQDILLRTTKISANGKTENGETIDVKIPENGISADITNSYSRYRKAIRLTKYVYNGKGVDNLESLLTDE